MQNDKKQRQPEIEPSETEGRTGDPGRTPGKAEGEDDSSATVQGSEKNDPVNDKEKNKA